MKLREYQNKTVNEVMNIFSDKERQRDALIHLPTGSGKTEVSLDIMRKLQSKICFIVRRKHLVYQTYRRIQNKFKDLKVSMVMADQTNVFGGESDIFVCSVDTLIRRMVLLSFIKMNCEYFIIDEAHDTTSKSYQELLKQFRDSGKYILGMTATLIK